jgi:hypothetical protein
VTTVADSKITSHGDGVKNQPWACAVCRRHASGLDAGQTGRSNESIGNLASSGSPDVLTLAPRGRRADSCGTGTADIYAGPRGCRLESAWTRLSPHDFSTYGKAKGYYGITISYVSYNL